jgi:hypothetical protein
MTETTPDAFKADTACFSSLHFTSSSPFLGLAIFLLLADLRSGLGDAAFYEISLNLELLLRAEVYRGVEGQVAR